MANMTDQEVVESKPLTAGARLAQARAERGLSVVDAAGKLRIAPRQIEALEADDYARLPGHTIARGFVRNYARLLQLDAESVLAAFEQHVPKEADARISLQDQKVQFSESGNSRHNRVVLWATLGIFLLTAIGYLLWRMENSSPKATVASASAPSVSATPKVVAPTVPPEVVVAPPLATDAAAAPSSSASPASAAASTTTPIPANIAEHVVHLAFEGAAWVEVRDPSGKVVWLKNNPAGSEQDITAAPPLSFTIGNAAKVKMTYNGDAFDLTPHLQGTVARFRLER